MALGFQHDDRPVGGLDSAAVERNLAERAAVGTWQFERDGGGGFADRPLLNADTQGAPDGMGGGLDLAEMNRAFASPFGCLKISGSLGGFLYQTVQFLLESLCFFVHDFVSGSEFEANASLRAFNSPILTEIM